MLAATRRGEDVHDWIWRLLADLMGGRTLQRTKCGLYHQVLVLVVEHKSYSRVLENTCGAGVGAGPSGGGYG